MQVTTSGIILSLVVSVNEKALKTPEDLHATTLFTDYLNLPLAFTHIN